MRVLLILIFSVFTSSCMTLPSINENTVIAGHKALNSYIKLKEPITFIRKSMFGTKYPVIYPAGKYTLGKYYVSHSDGTNSFYFESEKPIRARSIMGLGIHPGRF